MSSRRSVKATARGRTVTYSRVEKKDGSVSYLKSGKLLRPTPYTRRIVDGLLGGRSFTEARGHASVEQERARREFREKFGGRVLREGAPLELPGSEAWVRNVWTGDPGTRYTWYVLMFIRQDSRDPYPEQDEKDWVKVGAKLCGPVTLGISARTPRERSRGLTRSEFLGDFERIVSSWLFDRDFPLQPCTTVDDSVQSVWRGKAPYTDVG